MHLFLFQLLIVFYTNFDIKIKEKWLNFLRYIAFTWIWNVIGFGEEKENMKFS